METSILEIYYLFIEYQLIVHNQPDVLNDRHKHY